MQLPSIGKVYDTVVETVVDIPKRAMKKATRQVLLWIFPNPKKVLERWTTELLSQGKMAHKLAFGVSWWAVKKFITRNGPVDLYEHTLPDAAWFFRVGENGFHIVIEPNLDSPKEATTLEFETIEDFARLIQETTGTDPLVFLSEMIASWQKALDVAEENTSVETIDIRADAPYPAGALSNFPAYAFTIDGISCASMEGFLQSLKEEDADVQVRVCALVGKEAKKHGSKRNNAWKSVQKLWWRGTAYDREGPELQMLYDRAYLALLENAEWQVALKATKNAMLVHSIGSTDPKDTVLTEEEFCSRLMMLREKLT